MKAWLAKFRALPQESSIACIHGYQRLRPLLDRVTFSVFGFASECKQTPTCSEYTVGAIRRHGTIAGIAMGITRILSCR